MKLNTQSVAFSISILANANAKVKLQSHRVVNGIEVAPNTYPWFTAPFYGCGSSLVHKDILISAAHCHRALFCDRTVTNFTSSPWNNNAIGGEIYNEIEEYIHHKNFNNDCDAVNDIMVIKLKTPVTDDIVPIAYNTNANVPASGDTVRAIGIGRDDVFGSYTPTLEYVDLKSVDSVTCNAEYADYNGKDNSIGVGKMCAKELNVDTCQGDSGGPLFVDGANPTLIGITSYGIGCADNAAPSSVYARISDYKDFIRSAICCMSSDPPDDCAPDTDCPSDGIRETCLNYTFPEDNCVLGYDDYFNDDYLEQFVSTDEEEEEEDSSSSSPSSSSEEEENGGDTEGEGGETTAVVYVIDCFSSHTTAKVRGKGDLQMDMIEVGDEVITRGGSYKKVYAIDHRHETKLTEFVQVYCEGKGEPLELTANHMIFMTGEINPVPAGTLKIGDRVETYDGDYPVIDILTIVRKGLFSPLTTDGTIVASGIVVSTYSSLAVDTKWIEVHNVKLMSFQNFFASLIQPYKLVCTTLSMELCKTDKEKVMISDLASKIYDMFHSIGFNHAFISFAAVLAVLMNIISFVFVPVTVVWVVVTNNKFVRR